MTKTWIGLALSLAVSLSGSSLLAAGAGAGATGGSTAGSNAGTNVGSNQGTHIGSNQGTNVGSNAGTHMGSNAGANTGSNATNNPNPNNTNNNPPNSNLPGVFNGPIVGNGVIVDGGSGVVGSSDVGTAPSTNSPSIVVTPANPNPRPDNGGTPPLTGQITPDHSLTTANVPAPNDTNAQPFGSGFGFADRQTQLEGEIVDLYSITHKPRVAAPAPAVTGGNTAAVAPDAHINANATDMVTPPRVSEAGRTDSLLGATATVRKTASDTFGTYDHPGAATTLPPAPPAPGVVTNNEPSVIVGPNPALDSAAMKSQLAAGTPAGLLVNGQLYVLVCDPRQLSAYAGRTLRVTGRVSPSGALVPDTIESRQPAGDFRSITLTRPIDALPATASER